MKLKTAKKFMVQLPQADELLLKECMGISEEKLELYERTATERILQEYYTRKQKYIDARKKYLDLKSKMVSKAVNEKYKEHDKLLELKKK